MRLAGIMVLMFPLLVEMESVYAKAKGPALNPVDISLDYDTFREGAKVVIGMCATCHSLKYVKYRHLLDIGFSGQDVDAIRGGKGINSPIASLMPAENMLATYGSVPPDLSLMVRARKGGGRYIYSLLTGYYVDDAGKVDNHFFPGIAMTDPFGYAESDQAGKEKIESFAHDAVAFLTWASDPHLLSRRSIGHWVMAYLLLLTILMYFVKRAYWADIDKHEGSETKPPK